MAGKGATIRQAHDRARGARPRAAFTLIEILMVVATLAIIAGIVVPEVSAVVDDARHSTMLNDLREITNAIERYRMDHAGLAPDLIQSETLIQLVSRTDVDGNVGTGPEHIYGPYLPRIGPNALNSVSRVFRVSTVPPSSLSSRVGWVYHPASGQIWAGLFNGPVDLAALQAEESP